MTYFKIINNGQAVDAGWMWLQWNTKHKCLMVCEPRYAHYVQNYKETAFYRFGWLNPLPDGAPIYSICEGAIIEFEEYDELITALDDGEIVFEPIEPEPQSEPIQQPEPQTVEEHRMTVQEMREAIKQLTSMAAKEDYPQGARFVMHDEVYRATDPICKGTMVRPGYNCERITLEEVIG